MSNQNLLLNEKDGRCGICFSFMYGKDACNNCGENHRIKHFCGKNLYEMLVEFYKKQEIEHMNNQNSLQTKEEYEKQISFPNKNMKIQTHWSEPKYQCPVCGGGMCKNLFVSLSSNPVRYEYQCNKCGHVEYQYG